jgi:hypothetical protein
MYRFECLVGLERKGINMNETTANITCPECGYEDEVEMPQVLYLMVSECGICGSKIRTGDGDCCVFCSHADVKCPGQQEEGNEGRFPSSNVSMERSEVPDSEEAAC